MTFGGKYIPSLPAFSTTSTTTDSQVIKAIKRTEQVALLQLSIQGITSKTESTKVFGMELPGSTHAKFIQYDFDVKLGVEGKNVTISTTASTTTR